MWIIPTVLQLEVAAVMESAFSSQIRVRELFRMAHHLKNKISLT